MCKCSARCACRRYSEDGYKMSRRELGVRTRFEMVGMRDSDYMLIFFFFQAEDGIRDLTVTGVQTCALPISGDAGRLLPRDLHRRPGHARDRTSSAGGACAAFAGSTGVRGVLPAHHGSLVYRDRKSVV